MLSDGALAQIDIELAKYPPEQKRAAVMASLRIAQEEHGWLSQKLMSHIAGLLELEPIEVYEIATFYTMYELEPVGKHKINVCTNVSCMLCGSENIVEYLQEKLGIKLGETTEDGRYTLREVECLAACGGAPMMQIDKTYHENLTPERVDQLLEELER